MKRFLSTVVFCVFLLVFGLAVLLPSATAEKNLLQNLLNLPAAPPPNPASKSPSRAVSVNMYERENPPDDNAPIEELMDFWYRQNYAYQETGYNLKPSEETLKRILSEVRDKPEKLPNYLNILPEDQETQDFVKQMYDRQNAGIENEDEEEEEDGRLKDWLTYHSRYFSDELLKAAQQVGDTNEYVTNQKELLALARVDWEKAKPILDKLLNDNNQPVSQTLARWAFYQRAVKEGNSSDIETYRKQLQATVENKTAKPGNRDLAMDALVEGGDFEGRDDWYYTLLEDDTLHDLRVNGASYTGLTTLLNRSPKGKYTAKMLELINSQNPLTRRAAVRNLSTMLNSKNPEVIRALLPWLENPNWAQETNSERRGLVYALSQIQMPESVPGLLVVLNEKQTLNRMSSMSNSMGYAANSMAANRMTNSNAALSTGNSAIENVEYYPFRMEAVSALAMQKDARAIMPLRDVLPQVENWQANSVVRALLASGGFSIPEQVEAVETVARLSGAMPDESMGNSAVTVANVGNVFSGTAVAMTNTNAMVSNHGYYNRPFNSSDIKPILGQQLTQQLEPEEALVTALLGRLKILDEKEPQTAYGLRRIMLNWRGAAINQMLMRDVRDNKSDLDAVVKLLSQRKELRENQWNDINDMRSGSQTAAGIAACFMENSTEYDSLLQNGSAETKTAMLACARLIRAALPVQKVAENLKSSDKLLALAAERYLETEDSPEAQRFVLAIHPNEAKILGAKKVFTPDDTAATGSQYLSALFASIENSSGIQSYYYEGHADDISTGEKKLQKEVKENQELLGVYAYDDNFIRVYKDKAVFSWQSDKARFRERELSKEEFESFKDYVASERVNELAPFFLGCEATCEEKEFLMLGRSGGRRIYMLGDEKPRFFSQLDSMFEWMRQSPARLRYALEKNLNGLEILFEDENLSAETVWKNAADFRVLVSDAARRKQIEKELRKQDRADETGENVDYDNLWKIRRKRSAQREFENFAWYRVADGKLGGLADQPAEVKFIRPFDGMDVLPAKGVWKTKTAAVEIRADSDGLYKIAGGRLTKIGEGYYENPIITSNGKWAVATKFGDESPNVVRVNLTTRKETPVKIESDYYPRLIPIAFVPSIGKALIFKGEYSEHESEEDDEDLEGVLAQPNAEFYLLDPETGAVNKAKSEIRPLAQQTFRPLQTTGKPDEFWAAIPDAEKEQTEISVYNAKTLTFKPLLKLPEIEFNSMKMWIDEGKVYFVYEGHLLGLPLPK